MGAVEDWKRLGDQVVARRGQMGLKTRRELSELTGLSYRVLGDVERGTRTLSDGTLAILEQGLGWAPSSARRILAGGEPLLVGESPMTDAVRNANTIPASENSSPATPMRAMSEAYRIAAELVESGDWQRGRRLMEALGDISQSVIMDSVATPDKSPRGNEHEEIVNPTVLGVILGVHLRKLRFARGLSVESVSDFITCSATDIRLLELGRVTVSKRNIGKMLALYNVRDSNIRRQLTALVDRAEESGWWSRYNDLLPPWFKSYVYLEQGARVIRTFEAGFIPGLLQTPEYADAVIRLSGDMDNSAVRRRVAVRMERKEILRKGSGPKLWAVIDEAALRRWPAHGSVMVRQMEYLIEMNRQRDVVVQILPSNASMRAYTTSSFTVLRFREAELPDVVYIEELNSAIYMDRPEEVEQYITLVDRLSVQAMTPEESTRFLKSLLGNADMKVSGRTA